MVKLVVKNAETIFGIRNLAGNLKNIPAYEERSEDVIPSDEHYIFSNKTVLEKMIYWYISPARSALLLQGAPGCGKTAGVLRFADLLNIPVRVISFNRNSRFEHAVSRVKADQDGNLVDMPGPAMQCYTEGGILLLDEFNLAPPGVTAGFNALLDQNGVLADKFGNPLKRHKLFRVVLTANMSFTDARSSHFRAANGVDASTQNRCLAVKMDYPTPKVEAKAVSRFLSGNPQTSKAYKRDRVAVDQFVDNAIKVANSLRGALQSGEFPLFTSTRTLVALTTAFLITQSESYAYDMCVRDFLSDDEHLAVFNHSFRLVVGKEPGETVYGETSE